MRLRAIAALAILSIASGARGATHPALLADLPDDLVTAVGTPPGGTLDAAAVLDRILAAGEGFAFRAPGLTVRTDRRWFAITSVEGPGAPELELRRWPGDTVLAFYALGAADSTSGASVAGLTLRSRARAVGAWSARDGTLETPRGAREAVWLTGGAGDRRVGALGIAGDAGLGPAAQPDLLEAILAVVRRVKLDSGPAEGSAPSAALLAPAVADPPGIAEETKHGWQIFQGPGFTIGLPPGLRAMRLDMGVAAPRPMPYASVWLRGGFVDRDGASVVVGDGRRAGYVAVLDEPGERWRAGVAGPLGAVGAERIDEAPLDDLVLAATGASRAAVSHWKETGFAGDWLVFRLQAGERGIEIAFPVVSSWRSLALFWIPTTWRREGVPPAPPPIDPARSLGVRFDRLTGADRARFPQLEGSLFLSDLRLDVPRGWWPVANLSSKDGLPATFVDAHGRGLGRIARVAAGEAGSPAPADSGWVRDTHAGASRAASVWVRQDGAAMLLAKDGHGFRFEPEELSGEDLLSWTRMRESASFTKAARR